MLIQTQALITLIMVVTSVISAVMIMRRLDTKSIADPYREPQRIPFSLTFTFFISSAYSILEALWNLIKLCLG